MSTEQEKLFDAGPPVAPVEGEREEKGLECPQCGCHHFEVLYTRPKKHKIMRRRACRHCGREISTFERVQ